MDAPLSAYVARGVRAERGRHRWTQADLAERLGAGWSADIVWDLENGRKILTADDLVLLCQVLDATVPELAKGVAPSALRALGF